MDSKNGLSSDWVNSIIEDDRGFLWIGTRHGLCVYDGQNNLVFTKKNNDSTTISGNDISYLLKSRSGDVLLGTWGAGVDILNPVTKNKRFKPSLERLKTFKIKCLGEDSDTILWVGAYGDGIYRFDPKKDKLSYCRLKLENEVKDSTLFQYCETMVYHNDTLWLASRVGGLGYIDKRTNQVKKYYHKNYDQKSINQIMVLKSNEKKLLIGTVHGIYHELNTETGNIRLSKNVSNQSNSSAAITSILPDKDGSVWITTNSGIRQKNKNDEFINRVGPKNKGDYDKVFCSFQDSRGIVWLGNWGGGLSKSYTNTSNFQEINLHKYNSSHVNCLSELNDSIMLIGSTKGLLSMNQKTFKVDQIPLITSEGEEFSKANIVGLARYKEQIVLRIESVGIFSLDPKGELVSVKQEDKGIEDNTFIISFNGLENGEIWTTTWSEGAYLNGIDKDFKEKHFSVSKPDSLRIDSKLVYTAFLDKRNVVWLGTKEGVSYFDKNENRFVPLKLNFLDSQNKLRNIKDVKSIVQDKNAVYWFATLDGLVSYSIETRETRLFDFEDGLDDVSINGLVTIDDDLWGISKSGIMKLDVKSFDVVNYTAEDGLLPNGFNSSIELSSTGQIYICNGEGIEVFNPRSFSEIQIESEVYFEKFFIDNIEVKDSIIEKEHISEVTKLFLNYDQNNISFLLSTLDFTNRRENIFVHKLEGFDTKWVSHEVLDTRISYTNLNPGTYELLISKLNSDESINEKSTKKIVIVIAEPFWKTWWFKFLSILIISLLIYTILTYRTRAIKLRSAALEKYAHDRTIEIKDQNVMLQNAFKELAEKDKALNSNLTYASFLQNALQPNLDQISEVFESQFVMYKPRDVVSGDFYWSTKIGTKSIFVVADCTGHGVSGAFISVLGVTFTRFIVKVLGITRPDLILNRLHQEVSEAFYQSGNQISDGMDVSIICYDNDTKLLEVAGALSSPLVKEEGEEVKRIRGDRFPVGGGGLYKSREEFRLTTLELKKRTLVYQFTDGFQDQFSEKSGKKFMQGRFRDFLIGNSELSINEQHDRLENAFDDWKGNEKQVDDVLVVGFEIIP